MENENSEHEHDEFPAHAEELSDGTLMAHEELDGADSLEEDAGVSAHEIHDEKAQAAVAGAEAAPVVAVDDPGTIKHWYIIHAYSGFEQKVAESLKTRSQAFGFAERLGQILIPTEEVIELRNGKKVTSKRMLYPGYGR
jgi:transcriptional antiterminator NusG